MDSKEDKILLLQPPFFRFCGSHNERPAPSLCYLSSILDDCGYENVVYNSDSTGASKYWNMKKVFNNFQYFIDAVDDKSPLYDEVIEKIISYSPNFVVILGGDPLIPTTDIGSPFIGVNFSKRLRKHGIKTIALGPYYNLQEEKYIDSFDTILKGEPSSSIVDIIKNKQTGVVKSIGLSSSELPSFKKVIPFKPKDDLLFTSLGCKFPCKFCIAGIQYRTLKMPVRSLTIDTIIKDIQSRNSKELYFGDLNFSNYKISELEVLAHRLSPYLKTKSVTVDLRIDQINLQMAALLKKLNVKTVKIGLESFSEVFLKDVNKSKQTEVLEIGLNILKEFNISFVFYILLGGNRNHEVELSSLKKVIERYSPQSIITSIWAYNLDGDYKYDTHFSKVTLEKWNIEEKTFFDFLDLQNKENVTVGKIIDEHN